MPLCSLPVNKRADLFLERRGPICHPTAQILLRRPSKSVRATQHLFASGASVFQLSSLPIDKRADLFLGGQVQFATPTVQILVRRPSFLMMRTMCAQIRLKV